MGNLTIWNPLLLMVLLVEARLLSMTFRGLGGDGFLEFMSGFLGMAGSLFLSGAILCGPDIGALTLMSFLRFAGIGFTLMVTPMVFFTSGRVVEGIEKFAKKYHQDREAYLGDYQKWETKLRDAKRKSILSDSSDEYSITAMCLQIEAISLDKPVKPSLFR